MTGKVPYQPSFLAARMFVVRVRMALARSGAQPDAVRKHAGELRELFAQNADCRSVQQDLARIFS